MSAADPTPEFWILLREIEAGRITEVAVPFLDSAFEIVDGILATIASMRAAGIPAPTERQATALANLHRGACKWLGRVPTEEECREEMLRHRQSDSPHTQYLNRPGFGGGSHL